MANNGNDNLTVEIDNEAHGQAKASREVAGSEGLIVDGIGHVVKGAGQEKALWKAQNQS